MKIGNDQEYSPANPSNPETRGAIWGGTTPETPPEGFAPLGLAPMPPNESQVSQEPGTPLWGGIQAWEKARRGVTPPHGPYIHL